jgi:two-component system, LytTR family, sensor kinase
MTKPIGISRKWIRFITHLLVWMVFLGVPFVLEPPDTFPLQKSQLPPMQARRLVDSVIQIWLIVIFYVNYLLLIPRLYLKHNTRLYLVSVFCMFLTLLGCLTLLRIVVSARFDFTVPDELINVSYVASVGLFLMTWAASSGFRLHEEWREAELRRQETETRRMASELALLKAQINPHFLLNTLNNLSAIAILAPERTPEGLQRLSDMVRYVLYECTENAVSLAKEVDFVRNYLELQQLRLPPNVQLVVELPTEAQNLQAWHIEPMILMPFIENPFKHGISTSQPCVIRIRLQVEHQILALRVENTALPVQPSRGEGVMGMGLSNTRQRLKHSYPHRHSLLIEQNGDKYIALLTIKLEA